MLCVSGTSLASSAAVFDRDRAAAVQFVTGSGLDPHASVTRRFDSAFRSLVTMALEGCTQTRRLNEVVVSLDGVLGKPEEDLLRGMLDVAGVYTERIRFITRGVALLLANAKRPTNVILAHAGGTAYALVTLDPLGRARIQRGGFGLFSGDDGGGLYFIGLQLMKHVLRDREGGHDSEISAAVHSANGWTDPDDVVRWIRQTNQDGASLWSSVRSMANLALELAEKNSSPAQALVKGAADNFALSIHDVLSLVRRDNRPLEIGTCGPLFSSPIYSQRVIHGLKTPEAGPVHVSRFRWKALAGCIRLALDRCEEDGWAEFVEALPGYGGLQLLQEQW